MLLWRVFVVAFVMESLLLLCYSTVAQQNRVVYSRDLLRHTGNAEGKERNGGEKERNTRDL